jgi:hypothetical protein
VEEHYLKEGYSREFQTINRILGEFLGYLSLIGNSTSLANSYKSKGNDFKAQEKEQRENALRNMECT